MKKIHFRQLDNMDCGPTCLRMVSHYYGKKISIDYLRENSYISRSGVSLLNLSTAAEQIGFKTLMVKLTTKKLTEEAPVPCILHWNQEHYVVFYGISQSLRSKKQKYIIADPGHDIIYLDEETFIKCWTNNNPDGKGIALLMEPAIDFLETEVGHEQKEVKGFGFLKDYVKPHKSYFIQILLGMLFGSLISLIFPYLTQSMVDYGIRQKNLNFIYLVLASQLFLFTGGMVVDMIRNWIVLHVNTRISVNIISNFLVKLMKLPMNFFESKNIGDLTQRIHDHHRIEEFLTSSTIGTLFSVLNLFVFSIVLFSYDSKIFLTFLIGSTLSVVWILFFMKRRADLDYKKFVSLRENNSSIYELITGMQEIKLNNCERARRWEWERIQAKLFKINIKSLSLEQYQDIGSKFFTQLKNILITYYSVTLVLEGNITLGMMLSISYIIGQMNSPLEQIVQFLKSLQDTKMSLDRMSEIHNKSEEEKNDYQGTTLYSFTPQENKLLSFEEGITLRNLSFKYGGKHGRYTLKDLNLIIPKGKVTAIVGSSGSGKTTLMKLLLKFYQLNVGEIIVDGANMNEMSAKLWRQQCGSVMQDGFIFSDTILRNIAVDGDKIDRERLQRALEVSNLYDTITRLPMGLNTKIGAEGSGISGGQRQRIFIARAVYKNPGYLFFDEATSALDANNESTIMKNLDAFFEGRTVVIAAHRLSTVKNADQIIVLHNGEVVEVGNHKTLTQNKGMYFELVKNQLELDAA